MKRFHVFHQIHGQSIAAIEMDEELLRPEAGILDPETCTMRPLKNGGVYTLIPIDDEIVDAMKNLHRSYSQLQNQPSIYFRDYMGAVDCVLDSLKLLFGESKYVLVGSAKDMQKVLDSCEDGGEYQTNHGFKVLDSSEDDNKLYRVTHSFYNELMEKLENTQE